MSSPHSRIATSAVLFCAALVALAGCSSGDAADSASPTSASSSVTTESAATKPNRQSATTTTTPYSVPRTSDRSEPIAAEVVESGWSLNESGTQVSYGVRVRNNGPAASFPSVTVTALDADGVPLETKKSEFGSYVAAGADSYIGGTFINSADIADLQITTDPGQSLNRSQQPVVVTGEATISGSGYSPRIVLTAQSNSSEPVDSPARIDMVFRDDSGAIVGGTWAYTQSAIPVGGTLKEAPFISGFAPSDSTSVEVTISE